MTSGPVFVQVLEGENAIQKNRDLMGSTNPQADPGTIKLILQKVLMQMQFMVPTQKLVLREK